MSRNICTAERCGRGLAIGAVKSPTGSAGGRDGDKGRGLDGCEIPVLS